MTSACMRPLPTAVREYSFPLTASIFQRVPEDWHLIPGVVVVKAPGEPPQRAVVPGEPERIDTHGSEGVAEDAAKQLALDRPFFDAVLRCFYYT